MGIARSIALATTPKRFKGTLCVYSEINSNSNQIVNPHSRKEIIIEKIEFIPRIFPHCPYSPHLPVCSTGALPPALPHTRKAPESPLMAMVPSKSVRAIVVPAASKMRIVSGTGWP